MLEVNKEEMREFVEEVLAGFGAPSAPKEIVADSLIKSNTRGHQTHGLAQLPLYAEMISEEVLFPSAEPTIDHKTATLCHINGNSAFGQFTAHRSMELAIEKTKDEGMCSVGIYNGSHLGRLGEWSEMAAEVGFASLLFVNTCGGGVTVTPPGVGKRKISTNPFSFGIPTFDALDYPIILDMATSQISNGQVYEHARLGKPLSEEYTTTPSGEPVTDPNAFLKGKGALLPLGGRATGYKGFGLAIITELLAGTLGGGGVVGEVDQEWFSNSAALIVIDPLRFHSKAEIEQRISAFRDHFTDCEGVRFPGERGVERIQSQYQKIEITPSVAEALRRLPEEYELTVDIPSSLQEAQTKNPTPSAATLDKDEGEDTNPRE